jgi:hypothetical protein
MNSDTVAQETASYEALEEVGWEEDLGPMTKEAAEDWRKGLGTADGLLRTNNEVPVYWWHENPWGDNGEGKEIEVRSHSHANATFYPTDLHGLASIAN